MSKTIIPFRADDVSSLAKSLRAQLQARETTPGHVELLNMLARAVGRRNFQQLRAEAEDVPTTPPPLETPPIDERRIERVERCFGGGRLARWPARREDQVLALWGLWSKLPAGQTFGERDISQLIGKLHDFGDHALLRRELVISRLVERNAEGSVYRRVERPPPPDAARLIGRI
ncbi:hypothetical protein ASE17_18840 [Phenylobacterium sp. Root77]|uniref:DUF2087 domain-containing protein n=1 Tax=unclassified Phenylobacterium TaxID=2640670 RepID=UPI0006FFA1A0|nr:MULTISPECIES: DUF2087 domain-containing protein [unclassified Phenylobacterium]KQW70914.1 hypothetical protein ASC73_12710 [Phenylobacterium sp. Root1277]KQW90667.1 hypothetical protein ASC79_14880 [Phenylobacterium sp. Root1290]KRC39702.1 hypothetical protein ASE17_18840 [Phenylobacterium sp. Root77]